MKTHAEVMAAIDEYVARGVPGPGSIYRGWHDDNAAHDGTPQYRPVLQQCRAEWSELMYAACALSPRSSALQIGLGHPGGSHWALRQVFDFVLSIEIDRSAVDNYCATEFKSFDHPRDGFLIGDSKSAEINGWVKKNCQPFDLLFIDGSHTAIGVRADWAFYAPLVRPGGIVAMHDTVKIQPGSDVPAFVRWLEQQGQLLHHVRHPDPAVAVGISLMYVR